MSRSVIARALFWPQGDDARFDKTMRADKRSNEARFARNYWNSLAA
jgi:hypothetical protein